MTISSSISAAGVLTGKDTATLKFKSAGRIAFMNIKKGDTVHKGEILAGLDTRDLSISLQQAINDYRAKQATAEKVEDDVKDNDDDETFTQKETRTKAQAARDSAYDEVKAAQLALDNAVIFSPLDGTITQAPFLPNQIITAADTIAQVVDWSERYFDAEIDEADISKISLQQPVIVTLNAYPDQLFDGIVSEITPITQKASNGATVIIVRIQLTQPPTYLISGLNGEATITLQKKDNALVIPEEALADDDTVMIKTSSGYEQKKITVGIRADDGIEILQGLQEHDQIVLNPSALKK